MSHMNKALLIILAIIFIPSANSSGVQKRAVVRDNNYNAKIKNVTLVDLTSDTSYEGKYFKIVDGKNNDPIQFSDSEDLQLKAATTYYHLNKARKFFIETVKSEFVQNLPQLTIRIDLINVFNEIGHFGNDNLDPQFNNALSVPAGNGYAPKNIKPWGSEIWFRPSKEIHINDITGGNNGANLKRALRSFRGQTHMVNFQSFLIALLQGNSLSSGSISLPNVMRLVENSLMVELIYQSSDFTAELFSRKIYRLDSALVPEIIYHEFSHIALSNYLELSHSTSVNEGLADYFAGKIANSSKLALNIDKYNLFNGKDVKNIQQYQIAFERGEYANTDFVFGLLWNIGKIVGPDIETSFIYRTASALSTNALIRSNLLDVLLNTCKVLCKSPSSDRIKLYQFFNSKNL